MSECEPLSRPTWVLGVIPVTGALKPCWKSCNRLFGPFFEWIFLTDFFSPLAPIHTHTDTHMYIHLPAPPLSFLRFWSFLGLSLRLFRLLLRLVSLPQSRAKYSLFSFLHLSFSLALLALLFLSFFLSLLRLFRYLFRSHTSAAKRHRVCVSSPVSKVFFCAIT